MIRGHLTRKNLKAVVDNENSYVMIYKMARRLSDNKLYYIFLLYRRDRSTEDINEPYYLVTLREVISINDIYDLEISLNTARKIFSRKTSSTAEV